MAQRTSIYTDNAFEQILDPVTVTADATSSEVDMKGYDEVTFLANIGESGDTLDASNYIELEVEESDTSGSGHTDVANDDLVNYVTGTNPGTFAKIDAAAEDDNPYMTGYRGNKRYLQVKVNLTGTHTNGTPISITAIKKAMIAPANAVTTQ